MNARIFLVLAVLGLGSWGTGCDTEHSSPDGAREAPHDESSHDHTANTASRPNPAQQPSSREAALNPPVPRPAHPQERHLRNVRQLTFGGENAEAYLSRDGKQLIFQSTRPPFDCDQIFTMNIDGTDVKLVSTGEGRTTCSYFDYSNPNRIVYASTHLGSGQCPHKPDHSQGYVWAIYEDYDIFAANADGTAVVQLTHDVGYDAEATFSNDGERMVFTSMRDGDLEIYSMKADGSDVRRLTHTPGYDGGPFYSFDNKKIVFRGFHPEGDALAEYQRLLDQGLVKPSVMNLYVMDADGSNLKEIFANGAANFAPFFHPDGKRIIFSSNTGDNPREFDLYMINIDGTGLERITHSAEFDGFPMFTRDGKTLVFCSNRHNNPGSRDTNVFVADWVD